MCVKEKEKRKLAHAKRACVCVSAVRGAVRKRGRTDRWMLLALFINDFTTEIASSTTTGRHIAVTPLELCDISCRMYSVWV